MSIVVCKRAFLKGSFLPFVVAFTLPAVAQNPATVVQVDVNTNRHPIDPRIYGTAYGTATTLADLNFVINRIGGNNVSRYNWRLNADNRGNDWYFQSIGDSSAVAGERFVSFVQTTRGANVGAEPMITVPMVGYVARLGPGRSKLASFSIAKYGPQTGNDWQWFPDAGNGISATTNQPITGNNPLDANMAADSLFQQGLIQHLVTTLGTAANGGVKYYIYDNEPSLWHSTHRDVHPTGATIDEIKTKLIDYGTKIRAIEPGAILVGPEEWGWSGYFFSGYDLWYGAKNGWSNLPDKAAHGNQDYLPWLLDQMRQHENATGKRLLDIFSVHIYPQGGEFSDDVSQAMQLRRNRSTRALWDPNYVDETWIGTQVKLIPRLREWVRQYYPGIQTAITEYNWGAENHINGATAQADILGIFGREQLNLAARWTTPDPSTPTYKAMQMYRNYDGNKSTFGDTSVATTVANPDTLSAFAAQRSSDGTLTVMTVNKSLTGNTSLTLSLTNFASSGPAQVYQLTATNRISRLADIPISGASLTVTLPPQSITLFVVPSRPTFVTSAFAAPSLVPRRRPTRVTATLRATGNLANGIVNMEIYDPSGRKVYQMFRNGQTFSTNQTRIYTWTWRPSKPGTYTVKLGVFDSTWATLLHWNNAACTFTVR